MEEWWTRIGYIGPRRRPMKETAMAFSRKEGTAQIVASRLCGEGLAE